MFHVIGLWKYKTNLLVSPKVRYVVTVWDHDISRGDSLVLVLGS